MVNFSGAQWSDLLGRVRAQQPGLHRTWFNQLEPLQLAHGQLEIRAPGPRERDYLAAECQRAFCDAAQAITGRLVAVRFITPSPERPWETAEDDQATFLAELASLRLNDSYLFENFVTGPCNRLAHAASLAVSEAPGEAYNPLFIHGQTGLGKTHLLQAVCHTVRQNDHGRQILYLTCETFVNHFIEAIERGLLKGFRYRYRHVDLLVIDDIQFLAERDRSQEEFFHTFNTLYQLRKQIVLSADCQPEEIPSLKERLVSRFKWGLVARIDVPCFETRQAIIRKKARLLCMDLPEDVVNFLARRQISNIRELEGALTHVQAASTLNLGRIDLELATQVLSQAHGQSHPDVTVQGILDAVTGSFQVRPADVQGKRRTKSLVQARQICMYLARELTHLSLSEIGGYFGGRDHTTVLHAHRTVAAQLNQEPALRERLDHLVSEIHRP